jgi:UPF0176 protein
LGICGRIYVADEGVNAQMTIPTKNFPMFERALKNDEELHTLLDRLNPAVDQSTRAFTKLQIKLRREIVTSHKLEEAEEVEDMNNGNLMNGKKNS